MKHFIEAGFLAVMNDPRARELALANPPEKFNLVFASVAESGIVAVFDFDDDEQCKWINRFFSGRRDHNGNVRYCKYHDEVLQDICKRAYKQLSQT
jgi:hypothetical protein